MEEQIGGISYNVTGSTEDGIKAFEQLGQAVERAGQKVAAFGHQGGQILDTKGVEAARAEVLALEKAISEVHAKIAGANFDNPSISDRQWKAFGDAATKAAASAEGALQRVRDAQEDLNRVQQRAEARQGNRAQAVDPRIAQFQALAAAETALAQSGAQSLQVTQQNIATLARMYGVAGQAATTAAAQAAQAAQVTASSATQAATAAAAVGAAWQRTAVQANNAAQAQTRAARAVGGGGGGAGGRGGGGSGGGAGNQVGGFSSDVIARATDVSTNFVQLANSIRAIQANDRVNVTIKLSGQETPAQIQRVIKALDDLHAKERANIVIKANAVLAEDTVARLESHLTAAERRGAVIKLRVDTSDVEAATLKAKAFAGAFRGFVAGSNIGGGLLIGAQAGGSAAGIAGVGAAIGVLALTKAMIDGTSAGLKYNSQLEQATVSFQQFTGSAALAQQSIAKLRDFADKTPFSTAQTINVGRAFISLEHGDVEAMLRDVDLAGQLATVSKKGFQEGFEDATVAIRELMGGQTQSFATRFDISRETLNRLKEAGLAGHALVEAAVRATGASRELLEALGHTGEGELSTFQSRLDEIAQILTKPLFDQLTKGLSELNQYLVQNKGTWNDWAENAGAAFGKIGAGAIEAARGIGFFIDTTVKMQQYLNSIAHGRSPTADRAAANQRAAEASGGVTLTGGVPGDRRGNEEDARRQAAIRAANQEVERTLGLRGQEEVKLEHIERNTLRNAAAQAKIKDQYVLQLGVLQAILDMQNAPDFRRQREVAGFDRQAAQLDEVRRVAQAPVNMRAEVGAYDVQLKREQEIIDLKNKRRDIIKAIGDQEIAIANEVKEKQLAVAEEALKHWQQQIQAAQYLRQVAIDALRERQTAEKEARDNALRGMQESAQAAQQARQDAIQGIQDQQADEKQERDLYMEGLREAIRVRRDGVAEALSGIRQVMEAEQRSFENSQRVADRANEARQDSYRRQIQTLQDRNQVAQRRESGPTAAERELKALEAANQVRERARALEDATRAVSEARSSREWRDARRALARLQETQAAEIHKEQLQAQSEREKEQREKDQQKRQDQIEALQRKAQEEDRRYQRQKQAQEDAYRTKRDAEEAAVREIERAEKSEQRREDAEVRAEEAVNRAAEQRAKVELLLAQRQAAAEQRADQQAIRAREDANRAADQRAQEALRKAEKADKEQSHREELAVQAEQRRIEDERFRMQQATAARQLVADQQHLADMRAAAPIEIQLIDNRLKILAAENLNLLLWAAAAQIKFDDARARADNWDRIKEAIKAMAIIDTTERIYNLTEAEKARLFVLGRQREQLELQQAIASAAKADAQDAIDAANEAVSKLSTVEKNLAIKMADADAAAAAGKSFGQNFLSGLQEGVISASGTIPDWAMARGADIANAIIGGVFDTLNAARVGLAQNMVDWALATMVDPTAVALDSHSPSGVYIAFADGVIQGFVDEILSRNQEIIDAVVEPYDYLLNTTMPTFVRDFSQTAIDAHTAWVDEWNNNGGAATADQAVAETFVLALQSGVEFTLAMGEAGAAAAIAWENAWALQNLPQFVSTQMASIVTLINNYNSQFSVVGRNNAISWQNAFQSAMNSFHPNCPTCDAQGGGGGAGEGTHAGIMPQPSPGAPGSGGTRTGGGSGGPWYFSGRYDARGWPYYGNSNTGEVRAFPPGTNPNGGTASIAQTAGAALPQSMYAGGAARGGTGTMSVTSSRTVSLNVTNHISGADMDMEHLSTVVAQKTLDGVIAALDVTHQAAGTPTDRVLPGAL